MALGLDLLRAFQQRGRVGCGAEAVLASGFCHLASATRHRLHIPFPIGNRSQKPEIRSQRGWASVALLTSGVLTSGFWLGLVAQLVRARA